MNWLLSFEYDLVNLLHFSAKDDQENYEDRLIFSKSSDWRTTIGSRKTFKHRK